MEISQSKIFAFSMTLTILAMGLWLATGQAVFTRYQIVESVSSTPEEDDPLAATGFYQADSTRDTSIRDQFSFGLLPSGDTLLDKHIASVTTVVTPVWAAALIGMWRIRGRNRRKGASE